MADFQPLQAYVYNPNRVAWADVVTEPYDKITPAMQDAYYQRSPYNAVHVILGKELPRDDATRNKYARAAEFSQRWKSEGVLTKRPSAAYYYLEQEFTWAGQSFARHALIGRVRLTPFSEGVVRPHERTHLGPKVDRLKLLQQLQAHWGQVFLLCDSGVDIPHVVSSSTKLPPFAEFKDDFGVRQRLWEITDAPTLTALHAAFREKPFYVADGHHRYETAIAYRDERRRAEPNAGSDAPFEFVMATVVDLNDPGLLILPTHRLVKKAREFEPSALLNKLGDHFAVQAVGTLEQTLEWMRHAAAQEHRFGLCLPGGRFYSLQLHPQTPLKAAFENQPPLWEGLDVALSHVLILEKHLGIGTTFTPEEALGYYRDAREVAELVQRGEGLMGLFLNPTRVEQVKAVADAGSRMPQKSTDFYPKLPTGLVIYDVAPH
jgi:uncharacterized protein (DUF1015 family)